MMFRLDQHIRPNILALNPYSSARDEFDGREGIFLDANESPFGHLNRYPDPRQRVLKERLAASRGIDPEQVFIGNGSDEAIDLAFRIFCEPGRDRVVICPPTYGMYEVSAGINNVEVVRVPLTREFQPDLPRLRGLEARILFLCSPNNPTGNSLDHIEPIIRQARGIVFLDEAYIDFSERASLVERIDEFPNLIVAQTFSKARAHAAIRVGTAYASKEIIACFDKVKPPYNISILNQQAALKALDDEQLFRAHREEILQQRHWLERELRGIPCVRNVYPSDANFVLIEVDDAGRVHAALTGKRIIVRNRDAAVRNCLRITIGKRDENETLIQALTQL